MYELVGGQIFGEVSKTDHLGIVDTRTSSVPSFVYHRIDFTKSKIEHLSI